MSNPRGRGLMCAVDFTDTALRDAVIGQAYQLGMIVLPCGVKSVRFRPPLDITRDEVEEAIAILSRAVDAKLAKSA